MNGDPSRSGDAKRVAIILPDMRGGGVERMRLILADEFLRRGFLVDFVLGQATGDLLDRIPPQARLVDLKARRLAGMTLPLASYLRRERPDAVLAALWPVTSIAAVAVRLARIGARIVVSDHNTLSRAYEKRGRAHRLLLRLSIAATYPMADARVAVSKGIAGDLASLSGLREDGFTIIHNPAADVVPAGDPGAAAFGLWGEAPGARILSVGALKAQKNHTLLIRAFARLAAEREAALVILGEGPLRGALEALVVQLGLEGRIYLPGFLPETRPAYRAADLFVFSSDYEGFGNVLVEALACGVPVVSTDCPSGPAEILEDGKYGGLVPCGDADALASAMARSLDEEHDRAALRARASVFSPAAAADAYLRLLLPDGAAIG